MFAGTGTHQKWLCSWRSVWVTDQRVHQGFLRVSPSSCAWNSPWWWNKSCCSLSICSQTSLDKYPTSPAVQLVDPAPPGAIRSLLPHYFLRLEKEENRVSLHGYIPGNGGLLVCTKQCPQVSLLCLAQLNTTMYKTEVIQAKNQLEVL